jgi:hypothetical protein
MLRKYQRTPQEKFIALFKAVLESRVEVTDDLDFDQKPHVFILGAGGSASILELEPMTSAVEYKGEVDGKRVPHVLVLDEGVKAYLQLLALLEATEGIGDYLDHSFLLDRLNPQIQLLCLDPPTDDDAWKGRVKGFIKSLRGLESACRVTVPVVNLHPKSPLKIGEVSFHPQGYAEGAIVEPILKEIESKQNPPEEKAQLVQNYRGFLVPYLKAPCVAEVEFIGHESTAPEKAYELVREPLNLLRCYIPVLFGTTFEHRIGLCDDIGRSVSPCVALHGKGGYHLEGKIGGFGLEYEVDETTLTFLREKGAFDELSGVLARKPENGLETALRTAIWWIGTGNHLLNDAQQVVAMTTGLEALLIPDGVEDKADVLSRGAAHLLRAHAVERTELFQRMKKLYGMRSEVVHQGRLDIPVAELADLKYHALAVLVEMAKRAAGGWTKVKDLADAVATAEWGGEPVSRDISLIPRGPIRPPRFGRYGSHGQGNNCVIQP